MERRLKIQEQHLVRDLFFDSQPRGMQRAGAFGQQAFLAQRSDDRKHVIGARGMADGVQDGCTEFRKPATRDGRDG